ncbi:hypothetical protein EMIT0P218_100107 [Pseudomonas sp. IT-P218]
MRSPHYFEKLLSSLFVLNVCGTLSDIS